MSSQALAIEQILRRQQDLFLGRPLRRKEDGRLLVGEGKYVDDIKLQGTLYGAVLRSPYSHAKIRRIDASLAFQVPGVKLVLTAKDLPLDMVLPTIPTSDGISIGRPILEQEEVCFEGDAVAFLVADSRETAEDALELIDADYEHLPSVVTMEEAVRNGSPPSHSVLVNNVAIVEKITFGDVDGEFGKASTTVKLDLVNQRLAPSPLEPRACLASFQRGTQILTLWISTQAPFQIKSTLSEVLRFPENRMRVIGPEVGGAFGSKSSVYPEDVLVCVASMRLGVPVKWIETRTESFLTTTHGRGQMQHIELASDEEGKILGMKTSLVGDAGAYLTSDSSDVTLTLKMICGNYAIPAFEGEATVVLTNKVLHEAYRGAARPEATYAIERAIDELAHELRMDPAEVRLKNFIPRDEFPFRTVSGFVYDSGNYELSLQKALDLSDYEIWREEQSRSRSSGRLIGIGIASYVEICGFDADTPQTASILVSPSGKVTVSSGTFPHGQGHETPFSQIVADVLGISIDQIEVSYGDTDKLPWGTITAGSRSAALGGTAVRMCAEKIKEKMSKVAAHNLNIRAEDMVFESEKIFPRSDFSDSEKVLTFQQVASMSYIPKRLPPGMEPVLFAFSAFVPPDCVFPFGAHVAVVEVDGETGLIKILNYVSVDDCGTVINPLIVEGQIHGGIVQGLGQALLEGVTYDSAGQLLNSNFMDYQLPLAGDIPPLKNHRTVTPSSRNPLGIKGVGEAGTIAGTPAIVNAVADALSMANSKVMGMPLTPEYVYRIVSSKRRK